MKSIKNIDKIREFGFVFGIGLPTLFGLIIPLVTGHSIKNWTFIVGIIFIFINIFNPKFLIIPYKLWMKLGHVLGWINSRIILAIVFFLVLLPISIVMKLFGYDPLRKIKGQKTYRESKEGYQINLERIF